MSDVLWGRLTDLLNEMESADIAVNFGARQDTSTNWWAVPYVVNQRTYNIEVIWDRNTKRWVRG